MDILLDGFLFGMKCRICMRMGLKEKVLRMLDENDPSLRRHALLALSKMMVSKWQFLDVASEGMGEANQGRTR